MEPTESTLKSCQISRNTCDASSDNSDIISNFPEPIIHYILSFLQTTDLVNTIILSRRWRYLWTSMPYLDFDVTPFLLSHENRQCNDSLSMTFKDFVDWVLIFQNGSTNIQRFRLSCENLCDRQTIFRWAHEVTRRNVQEFDLSFFRFTAFELPHCLVASKTLVVLKLNLYLCVLQLPSFTGFSRLTTLELKFLELSDEDLTKKIIASCPLLENLSLIGCILYNLKVLDISATNLKNLTIENFLELDLPTNEGLCNSELKISCPNLVSFKCMGPVAQDYSLNNTSHVDNVIIYLTRGYEQVPFEEVGFLLSKILNGLYNAKAMELCSVFLEFLYPALGKPGCFSTSFYNLKSLKLSAGLDECYMQVIVHLLKHSPNLEALAIVFEETCEWNDYWELQDEAITCLTYHLKMVELIGATGKENELEFVRVLLNNGLVLEKMIVTWATDHEKQMEIIRKVLSFPKASLNVALTFLNPKSDADFFNVRFEKIIEEKEI